MMKVARDQFIRVFQESGFEYTETKFFISHKKNEYKIQVPNMDFPNRIDFLGFYPPLLPGVTFIPPEQDYGKLLAQLDTLNFPPDYVLDVFRIILFGFKKLKTETEWVKTRAPTINIQPTVRSLILDIYNNSIEKYEYDRQVAAENNRVRAATLGEAVKNYISTNHDTYPKSSPDLPRLEFDKYEDSGLISDPDKTKIPTGNDKDTIPDLPRVTPPTTTRISKIKKEV